MCTSQILLFQTTNPADVKSRLLRFREAFLSQGPGREFAVVSFITGRSTEVRKIVLNGIHIDHYIFSLDAIETLRYPTKGASRPFKLIPGNCDLITILFRKSAPQYEQYWVVEDDVDYSGDVAKLFSRLDGRSGDMLATHLAHGYDNWAYSSMFRSPKGNISPADTWLVFLTFFRISGRAIDTIDDYYQKGWSGHSENTWATILKHAEMQVVDIGGNGRYVAEQDRNKLYYGLPNDGFEKGGSFGTKNIRLFVGRRKDVLWHPIKRPEVWARQNYKRLLSVAKWYIGRLRFDANPRETSL